MTLLVQLTSINGCLSLDSVLVRINELKYNFGKQKSDFLVKMFRQSRFQLLDCILKNKQFWLLMGKIFFRINRSIRHWNYPILSLFSDTNISSMEVVSFLF